MSHPVFCSAADDDTGATDLAGMLAEHGLRTVLVVDGAVERWSAGYDAVIVGTGARALPADEAYRRTREAVRNLRKLRPRVIQIKYCSTFDSTADGNIGPSLDAALDETGETFTVALPALPVNGRTTYMGYHFVHRQLLSDSPMRDHPLTPMRNSHLVSHLQSQTRRRVGLAAYPVTLATLNALREEGVQIAILDCISESDLISVCEAIVHFPLISGSSAFASRLAPVWKREGWCSPGSTAMQEPERRGHGCLIVAGSCSVTTRAQNEWIERCGVETVVLDPLELLQGITPSIPSICTCLLRTASSSADVARVHDWASANGITPAEAGLRIAYAIAAVVRRSVDQTQPAGLIIAGGETASAICRTLEFGALEVGRNIEPGVPLCVSLGGFRLLVVLKSGNFGSPDFYGRALRAIHEFA